ncbi:acyl-CoA N-acyltransferase, partial [Dimargaris cristalligena]
WVCDSNDAVQFHQLNLTRPITDHAEEVLETAPTFLPEFTYPLFGEHEKIFGYKGLTIDVYFSQAALRTHLNVRYQAIHPTLKETPPSADSSGAPPAKRTKFTLDQAPENLAAYLARAKQTDAEFKPMGECIHRYQAPLPQSEHELVLRPVAEEEEVVENATNPAGMSEDPPNGSFELYLANFNTPGLPEYHRRIQSFLPFYIEGASFIDEDPQWDIYLLFRVLSVKLPESDVPVTRYALVGYSTVYRFYCYPDRVRPRISQFLILPTYAGAGHGSEMYQVIHDRCLNDPKVIDLSVEDPNQAFSDLRDKWDVKRILQQGGAEDFSGPFDQEFLNRFRLQWKLSKRQAARCLEMLMKIHLEDNEVDGAERAYRLQVKKRLYLQNKEALSELEPAERIEKLQETFKNVDEDYTRI